MSKKNSSVILKSTFCDFEELSLIYSNFRNKLDKLKRKSYLVAISGGPDSLALAALSKAYSFEKKTIFYYVLVNHNIRSKSSKEAEQVKALLKNYDIRLNVLKNNFVIKKNIQAQARKVRYEMLNTYCIKKNIKTILTGHNLDDQVETFFIRLSRGSGLTGLSAMKPLTKLDKKIELYRPLLDVKKNSLIKISKKIFKKYIIDPSNKDTKFLRTKIRNLKRPLMKSGINYDQIIKSINNLASSREVLDQYLEEIFKDLIKVSKKQILIDYKQFKKLNLEVKMQVIHKCIKVLKKNYYNLRSKKVNFLLSTIEKQSFKKATLGGCLFFKKKDDLCVIVEKSV
ncbi:tRNA lysidine(34) synthetase TilS [Candidatus Pelagibacter communis]|uniref:tRNA lysidine(34) synthetase TilS n=1 Tax=Pelagibacter ubique TaxID=198252 RepID=UPI0009E30BE7|nr:tRNA lysidine(34) synthetase TilS [Candidatus Pelagibacter ubique]